MTSRLLATAVVAVVLGVSGVPGSASAAPRPAAAQRVAIEHVLNIHRERGSFVLRVLTTGTLRGDTGAMTPRDFGLTTVAFRNGQGVATYEALVELASTRGSCVLHERFRLVAAGNGYSVGTGTWNVAFGAESYSGLVGAGRLGIVITPAGKALAQLEGFVRRTNA